MMIDFVKIRFSDRDKIEQLILDSNNFKKCFTKFEYHSAEIMYPYNTIFDNMELSVKEKSAYLKNSLHKMSNSIDFDEAHNHNDFTFSRLCEAIDYLDNKVIDSSSARLTQLEFGLNLSLSIPAKQIILNNIIFHKYNLHNVNTSFNGQGTYKQFEHSNYYIKIYDKAQQYKLDENLLRFEIKYKNSKGFNPLGVYNLSDLKDKKVLKSLFNDLLKRFEELTIIDEPNESIPTQDLNRLHSYLSYNFWEKMSERKLRNKKPLHIKNFNDLLKKHGLLSTREILKKELENKFNYLLNK